MKTMLAHSSIENAGIIAAGFGAFLVFRNSGNAAPAAIALTAAIYHLVNHSVYKALLYQGAGHIEAPTGTRDIDRLGGLIRFLPALSVVFLVGCLAISAVPPFNGFVSEWLTLQTFLRSAVLPSALVKVVFALAGAILALTAALAVTCFVKVYAMSFPGNPPGKLERAWRRLGTPAVVFRFRFSAVVVPAARSLANLCDPRARSRGRAASRGQRHRCTGSTILHRNGIEPATPAGIPPRFSQSGRTNRRRHLFPGRGPGASTARLGSKPGRVCDVTVLQSVALAFLLLVAWFVVNRVTRHRSATRSEIWAGGIPRTTAGNDVHGNRFFESGAGRLSSDLPARTSTRTRDRPWPYTFGPPSGAAGTGPIW